MSGIEVIEWPALENCVTLAIEEAGCEALSAVFNLLAVQCLSAAEQPTTTWKRKRDGAEMTIDSRALPYPAEEWVRVEEPPPWPFPTGKAPEKPADPPKPAVAGLMAMSVGRYQGALAFNGEE